MEGKGCVCVRLEYMGGPAYDSGHAARKPTYKQEDFFSNNLTLNRQRVADTELQQNTSTLYITANFPALLLTYIPVLRDGYPIHQ